MGDDQRQGDDAGGDHETFDVRPKPFSRTDAGWVRPKDIVRVERGEVTPAQLLRDECQRRQQGAPSDEEVARFEASYEACQAARLREFDGLADQIQNTVAPLMENFRRIADIDYAIPTFDLPEHPEPQGWTSSRCRPFLSLAIRPSI